MPRPIIKSHWKTKWGGLGLRQFTIILGLPYSISASASASDFKFGKPLGFVKAHHKITLRGKSGHGLGLGELPKNLGFPYNIFATTGASDFKFSMLLGFGKAHDLSLIHI